MTKLDLILRVMGTVEDSSDSNLRINLLEVEQEEEMPELYSPKGDDDLKDTKVTGKKKKTFEIDIELERYLRVEAAIKDISINEFVNSTLWKAISSDTKEL